MANATNIFVRCQRTNPNGRNGSIRIAANSHNLLRRNPQLDTGNRNAGRILGEKLKQDQPLNTNLESQTPS